MDKDKPIETKLPWEGDEHHGQGGSFIFDPKTGRRTRVPADAPKPEPAAASASKKKE